MKPGLPPTTASVRVNQTDLVSLLNRDGHLKTVCIAELLSRFIIHPVVNGAAEDTDATQRAILISG